MYKEIVNATSKRVSAKPHAYLPVCYFLPRGFPRAIEFLYYNCLINYQTIVAIVLCNVLLARALDHSTKLSLIFITIGPRFHW